MTLRVRWAGPSLPPLTGGLVVGRLSRSRGQRGAHRRGGRPPAPAKGWWSGATSPTRPLQRLPHPGRPCPRQPARDRLPGVRRQPGRRGGLGRRAGPLLELPCSRRGDLRRAARPRGVRGRARLDVSNPRDPALVAARDRVRLAHRDWRAGPARPPAAGLQQPLQRPLPRLRRHRGAPWRPGEREPAALRASGPELPRQRCDPGRRHAGRVRRRQRVHRVEPGQVAGGPRAALLGGHAET